MNSDGKDAGAGLAVSQFWDRSAENKASIVADLWTNNPMVRARINKLTSGRETHDCYQYMIETLRAAGVAFPVNRIASFGCGTGDLERGLAQYNIGRRFHGFDVSPNSIEIARREAGAISNAHLEYSVIDLNRESFGENLFEFAVVNMSLHHIEELEFFTKSLHRALTPRGWLFINEYVGPTRFQWTDAQLNLMNQVLESLPAGVLREVNGTIRTMVPRPTIPHMIAVDPSEAVRSAELMQVLSQDFELVDRKDYGGALLQMMLSGIVQNFTGDDGEALLKMIFLIEDVAMQGGLIASDFCTAILRAK